MKINYFELHSTPAVMNNLIEIASVCVTQRARSTIKTSGSSLNYNSTSSSRNRRVMQK